MSEEHDDWITIVAPTDEGRARAEFEEWKRVHGDWSQMLGAEDIRLDIMRGLEGRTLYRYRVRSRVDNRR